MTNRFLNRQKKREKTRYHGHKSEEINVKKLGGRQTPASGALTSAKSDGYTPTYQYENKSTTALSYRLQKGDLNKLGGEADTVGRVPAFLLSFVLASGKSKPEGDFVILRQRDFVELARMAYGDEWTFERK